MEEKKAKYFLLSPFGCQCFILNTKYSLEKFDSKRDKGILLSYSKTSRAFKVYNSGTLKVEEVIHVKFNESDPNNKMSELDDSFVDMNLDDIASAFHQHCQMDHLS